MKNIATRFLLFIALLVFSGISARSFAQGTECGDGVCQAPENCSSCEADCGDCTPVLCGNGECKAPETCASCPVDCGPCTPIECGDGKCTPPESCGSCQDDCGVCPI